MLDENSVIMSYIKQYMSISLNLHTTESVKTLYIISLGSRYTADTLLLRIISVAQTKIYLTKTNILYDTCYCNYYAMLCP